MKTLGMLRALARPWPSPVVQRVVVTLGGVDNSLPVVTVPGGRLWQPQAIRYNVFGADTGANRDLLVTVSDGTDDLYDLIAPGAVQNDATSNITFTLGEAITGLVSTAYHSAWFLPGVALPAGYTLTPTIIGADGDIVNSVTLTILEVFTGDVEAERSIEQSLVDHAQAIADLVS